MTLVETKSFHKKHVCQKALFDLTDRQESLAFVVVVVHF